MSGLDAYDLFGGVAQLGEHLLGKQGVVGSIPSASTKFSYEFGCRDDGVTIIAEGIPIGSSRSCKARMRRRGFVVSGISIVLCQCEEVGAFLDVPLFGLSDPYGAIHALRMTGHGQKRVECSVSKDRVVRRLLHAWDLSYLRRFGMRQVCWIVVGGFCACGVIERDKGIRWMPWHQEATKDVARCEKPWGAASRL